MQMFHVILASALQHQSEAAVVFHDRAEVPQGISSQMDSALLPQEAMDWRWNFQMVCGFALGVFTTMAIVYYYKMKKEKRSEDEALDEVQESLDNYLIGALRVQRHQRGVLIRSKVGELLKENSFLRARRQQGEEDLDRVHNQVEELQLENENLKKEIKELKSLILEDEAMVEDLAAEEEEKEEDPEVQSEEKQRPEESTTDDDMPALIPAEGDAPVVNEEAMERRKRELAIMREKAKKRREGKKEGTKHVWRGVLHTPSEPASASYQHPPEVQQQQREEGGKKGKSAGKGEGKREGEEDATHKSLHQLQAENYNEDEVLFTDLGVIWKFIKSSTSYQAVKEDKKGGLYYPNAPIKGKGEWLDQTNRYRRKGRWVENDRDRERQEKGKSGKGPSQEEQQQETQQQQGDTGSYKGSNQEQKGQKGYSGEGKGGKNYHDYQNYQKGKGKGKPWWATRNVKGWSPKSVGGKVTHYGKKGQWFSDGQFYPFDSHDSIYQWNANAGYSHSWYNDQGYVDENEYQLYTGQDEDDNNSSGHY